MKRLPYIFLVFTSCVFFLWAAGKKDAASLPPTEEKILLEDAPIITSATYQHTQYNGRNQSAVVRTAKDDSPLVVTYFKSEEDFERDRDGSAEPPYDVGSYYVKIERPEGNGYRQGKSIKIEYHIQKAFISLIADPVQRFVYDGSPKEAVVHTEPPVDIIINYFNTADSNGNIKVMASLPVERGRYRAVIIFSGKDRYMGASKEIELLIE
jgi:hypothetical protein